MESASKNNLTVSSDKIVVLLKQIIQLLQENDQKRWAVFLEGGLKDYLHLTVSDDKKDVAKKLLNCMKGGMGSLLDVALQVKNEVLIAENNLLASLLHQLYTACEMVIYPQLSARIAANFVNGEYETYEVDLIEYVVYRVSSKNEPMGQFFTEDKPSDTDDIYRVKVPQGAIIYVGEVIPNRKCKGGMQIFLGKSSLLFDIQHVGQ